MTDKIRGLQKQAAEKYQEAEALLGKAGITDAEQTKAAELIESVKGIKRDIAREFKLADMRDELDDFKSEFNRPGEKSALEFTHTGSVSGNNATAVLGMTKAGAITIDSFGSVLEDFKGNGAIDDKRWEHISDPLYKTAFFKWVRAKGNERAMGPDRAYYKALQEGLDDQGGIMAPADMLQRIIMREPTPTRVAGMVTTITTGRDRVTMPRTQYSTDDLYTTAFRATWTGEIPSSSTVADVDDTSLFGQNAIDIYTAMMSASLTNDFVEDSYFPIQGWVESQLRITNDLLKDNMVINGSGIGQPTGILANPTGTGQPTVVLSGTANDISADAIVDLPYQIPEQYDENCSWCFNKTNFARTVAKLKDSQNNYLFSGGWDNRGIANSRPTNLVGYPFAYSGFMPNIGDGAYPAIFGDFRGYYLANRLGITFQVLRETKAKQNQFELVARLRFGGRVIEPWRLRILKSDNA